MEAKVEPYFEVSASKRLLLHPSGVLERLVLAAEHLALFLVVQS